MAYTNSKEKKLGIPEIITHALTEMKKAGGLEGVPIQAAMLAVVREGSMEGTTVEQIGNTVFISHYSPEKTEVAMRAMNADTARNYLENSIQYVQALANSGVVRMTSDFSDKRILQLFKAIANRPEFSRWGMKIMRLQDGQMRAYVVMNKGA